MSEKTYPITGIPLVPGAGLPVRQEITAWFNNDAKKYQVSLFMQALTKLEELPTGERLSFFQIAGVLDIHIRYVAPYAETKRHS